MVDEAGARLLSGGISACEPPRSDVLDAMDQVAADETQKFVQRALEQLLSEAKHAQAEMEECRCELEAKTLMDLTDLDLQYDRARRTLVSSAISEAEWRTALQRTPSAVTSSLEESRVKRLKDIRDTEIPSTRAQLKEMKQDLQRMQTIATSTSAEVERVKGQRASSVTLSYTASENSDRLKDVLASSPASPSVVERVRSVCGDLEKEKALACTMAITYSTQLEGLEGQLLDQKAAITHLQDRIREASTRLDSLQEESGNLSIQLGVTSDMVRTTSVTQQRLRDNIAESVRVQEESGATVKRLESSRAPIERRAELMRAALKESQDQMAKTVLGLQSDTCHTVVGSGPACVPNVTGSELDVSRYVSHVDEIRAESASFLREMEGRLGRVSPEFTQKASGLLSELRTYYANLDLQWMGEKYALSSSPVTSPPVTPIKTSVTPISRVTSSLDIRGITSPSLAMAAGVVDLMARQRECGILALKLQSVVAQLREIPVAFRTESLEGIEVPYGKMIPLRPRKPLGPKVTNPSNVELEAIRREEMAYMRDLLLDKTAYFNRVLSRNLFDVDSVDRLLTLATVTQFASTLSNASVTRKLFDRYVDSVQNRDVSQQQRVVVEFARTVDHGDEELRKMLVGLALMGHVRAQARSLSATHTSLLRERIEKAIECDIRKRTRGCIKYLRGTQLYVEQKKVVQTFQGQLEVLGTFQTVTLLDVYVVSSNEYRTLQAILSSTPQVWVYAEVATILQGLDDLDEEGLIRQLKLLHALVEKSTSQVRQRGPVQEITTYKKHHREVMVADVEAWYQCALRNMQAQLDMEKGLSPGSQGYANPWEFSGLYDRMCRHIE